MPDPLSVAGLTFAIFDELLTLGERTAQFISDARTFDHDTTHLYNTFLVENGRTRLLKALLFSESNIYRGQTLFEQFDPDIQKQIEILLGQLKSILREGCDLLEKRYSAKSGGRDLQKISSRTSDLSTASTVASTPTEDLVHRKSSPSLQHLLLWSFRDKKRVETIVLDFNAQNSRIHESIKLWCLASQLGVDEKHLQRLQSDDNSKRLGFDVDATLRLTLFDVKRAEVSLELKNPSWARCLKTVSAVPNQGLFTMITKDGKQMIQENHAYEYIPGSMNNSSDDTPAKLDPRTRKRIESLAQLLHQPKEQVFRIPRCIGWKVFPAQDCIAFVFEVQPNPQCDPISLLSLVSKDDMKPELGDKFRLALGLARCISQLHMVQWVHESFRSENILFFPQSRSTDGTNTTSTTSRIDFTSPWVLGFMYAKPENYFSHGPSDFSPTRDIYRHPERQGQPSDRFSKIHDIYALGVVLLEIGLWEPAIKLEKNMFAHASSAFSIQAQLIKHAQKRLESRVGKKYRDIVIKCLTGSFGVVDDTKEDLKLQQAFRTQVVDVIEKAADYV